MSADLYDVIARRRVVRAEFSGGPVGPDVLERVLGAAHCASSVGHSQPWDFVLVRDRAPARAARSTRRPSARLLEDTIHYQSHRS